MILEIFSCQSQRPFGDILFAIATKSMQKSLGPAYRQAGSQLACLSTDRQMCSAVVCLVRVCLPAIPHGRKYISDYDKKSALSAAIPAFPATTRMVCLQRKDNFFTKRPSSSPDKGDLGGLFPQTRFILLFGFLADVFSH